VLRITGLDVVYDRAILVLKGLSLEVPEGRIVALLGPNGAGKSTTLKAISGLLASERGEVTAGGIELRGERIAGSGGNLPPEEIVRRGLFQVMEGRRVFEDLTVAENLAMGGYTRRDHQGSAADRERCFDYFPRLRELRGTHAGYLSGGEQQMLAIGRALMARPKLILLDEPSLGLAPLVVQQIFRILARINRDEGVTFLLVEQNANLALSLAHFAYVLEAGHAVLSGPSEELRRNAKVKELYLGGKGAGSEEFRYRDARTYRRRKRAAWSGGT
jgi:branched-chain amino acid transport system ATP-binding protein